ncbi:MAG: hypothetical protein RLZZ396_1072, partial [Planctomycetota bacterium]
MSNFSFSSFGASRRQRSKSSRRVVSSRQLSYEALELRRLLAREILNDVIDPAKPLYYSDPEEIIVHAGVRLDAGSHKIQLVAPKITILQNAQIGSDQDGSGEVFLTANTSYTEKGTVTAFGMVSIASGAVLRGSTISIVGEHGLKIDTSTGSTQVLATHSLEMESLRGKVELGIGSTIGTNFQGRSPSVTMHSGNSDVVLGSYSKVQTLSGDLEIAADTITLGTHSQLKSFGGKINLRGVRSVSLEDSVGLDSVAANNNSAGAISIASDNRLEYLPIALYDTFALSTRPHTTSSIFLADNVSIIGGDIALDSKAGDQGFLGDPDFLSRSDNPGVFTAERVKSLANILLGVFNDLIPSPISVLVREPTSTITVSSGVQLHAQGDLSVSSQSDAFAISTALWRYLDAKVPFLGGAVGVSYTDASATIDVLGGSELTATNNVDLATYVGNITSASAAVNTEKTKLNIAVGLAIQNSTSKLTVSEGSQIAAGKQVNIDASAKDLKQAQGRSSSFGDLYAGVVVAGVEGTTDVQALIDGQVYAFGTAPAHELIVNPQTQIDYADNAILFEQDVPFRTGDTIYYRTNLGMKLPGLEDGQQVFAILEPANNRKLKLAESRSNAALGKPISFGSAYPTLTNPSGKKVSVFQIDAVDNTLLFEWPDNAPLFSSGQTVTFTAAADRFIGLNDSSGHLVGELASGAYRVEVLPQPTPRAIRLLDANGKVVDLSDNPVFQTESGQLLQVFQFDGDDGTINFNFDPSYPFAPPNQIGPSNPAWELKPGQKLRYIGTLGTRLIGIESKSDYYAIPDRNAPGVIRLASSQRQALSASVSASASAPQIEAVSGSIAGKKSVSIAQVNPAGLLVLNVDPSISSGTQVLYHQSPGLQIEGLVDGRTYYATSVENPEFSSDMPEYYLELRESADPHLPPIYLQKTHILVDELGNRYTIDSIDAATQWLSVGLPSNVTFSGVDSTHLVGKVTHKSLSGDVIQFWNTATEGRFALRVFDPADASRTRTLTTRSLPWNAAAAQVESALREILSTNITVFGVGTSDSPWTILSPGVIFTNPDLSELIGGEIRERSLDANYFTVQAEASSGVFRLELSLSSRVVRSDEIPWNASAEQVRQALAGLGVQSLVNGQGTVENPWVIRCWQESIAESDLLRFQPGWGLGSLGLLSNQNYYAIVAPKELQTRPGSLVLGLSANRPEIPGSNSERLPLFGALDFHSDRESVPTGLYHQLSSRSDGIHIKADLISKDVLRTGIDRRLQKQVAYPEGTSGKQKFLSLIPISSVNLWNLTGKLKTEFETSPVKLQSNEVLFSVSPTYAWMNVSNTVRAVAQQHALLVTSGAIEIKATIDEYLTSKAQATVSAPSKTKLGVAVSVDWVRVSNSVDALIESNAIVTAAMGLSVDSRVNYPWQGQVFLNPNAKDHPGYVGLLAKTAYKVLGGQNGAGAFAGKIGLNDFFLNHYTSAASHSAGNLTSDDAQLPWAIATSFSWIDLQNQTWAQIEDGAQVNTLQSATTPLGKLTIFPTLLQSVDVSAQTNAIQTSFTGNVIANVDVNLASKLIKYKDRLPLLNRDTGTNSGRQALGGAVGTFVFGTDTRAVIGGLRTTVDGGELKAIRRPLLPMNIVAGSGGIAVDAQNNVTIVQATLGSGKGTNFGFSGSAAVVKGSQSNAYAAIEVGNVADTFGGSNPTSKLLIRSVQGGTESKDQGVQVHANDDTQLIPLAGAVFISENKGAGASTSIATLNRDVASLVTGSTLDDAVLTRSKLRRIPLEVTVGDPLDVRANASGLVIPTAIAAAVASGVKPDGQAVEIPGDQVENAAE